MAALDSIAEYPESREHTELDNHLVTSEGPQQRLFGSKTV